ncbi:MAG: transaldolase [Legionellales bacterium]|nr:transaldolase [Legionellales bacterium]|tara:strand:- start:2028 stop:2744 length:717 start_codon:yes stop_codon:yes gene_type:complete
MRLLSSLAVKIYADGANKHEMIVLSSKDYIKGLTTNPSLMRHSGITDYSEFCKDILTHISNKPILFEVFSDDFYEMERQARIISSWGKNVYVKIPVMNTRRESSYELIRRLSYANIKLNVTAIMTLEQVERVSASLSLAVPSIISIFVGRIADTGVYPVQIIKDSKDIISQTPSKELLWASPRELLNIFQANSAGCDIITVNTSILSKLNLLGKDLTEFSLETVRMFHSDAETAGYVL